MMKKKPSIVLAFSVSGLLLFAAPGAAPQQLDCPIRKQNPGPATSFAAGEFAGVAALWLAFHGKQNLLQRYPNTPLASVFASLLPECVTTPPGWDTGNAGPGIIDAAALLARPLPPEGSAFASLTTESLMTLFQDELSALLIQDPPLLETLRVEIAGALDGTVEQGAAVVEGFHALVPLHGSKTLQAAIRDGEGLAKTFA